MEVSGRKEAASLSDSVDRSSTEAFDISCQPCSFEGKNVAAEGYCRTCNEYMCKTCLAVHRKQSATRNHTILGKDHMPKSQIKGQKPCSKPCNIHTQEIVKFYCKGHDTVGCGDCMVLDHKNCNVDLVENVSSKIGDEQSGIRKRIKEFKNDVEKTASTLQSTKDDVTNNYTQLIEDIQVFRKEINKYLDDIEAELLSEANKAKLEAETTVVDLMKDMKTLQTDLDSLHQEIDSDKEETNNLFVSVKQAKEKLSYMKMSHSLLSKANIRLVEFARNEDINRLMLDNKPMGMLKTLEQTIRRQTVPVNDNIMEATPSCVGKIEFKDDSSKQVPKISGMAVISANELVAVDNRQQNIRLITIDSSLNVKYTLSLTASPFDITSHRENHVALTIPAKHLVKIISVQKSVLKEETSLSVNGECYGISHFSDGFVVSFLRPGKVEIIDTDGNLLRSIVSDSTGEKLFDSPQYVDICRHSRVIYVSDTGKQELIIVTPEGNRVGLYKETIWPEGVFALGDGKCLVAMYVGNISVISSDGTKLKTCVRTTGILKWMWAICYSYEHKKLFVSHENGRAINVYKLQ